MCVSVFVCSGKGDPWMDKRWSGNLRSVSADLSLPGPCVLKIREIHCVCVYLLRGTNVIFHGILQGATRCYRLC